APAASACSATTASALLREPLVPMHIHCQESFPARQQPEPPRSPPPQFLLRTEGVGRPAAGQAHAKQIPRHAPDPMVPPVSPLLRNLRNLLYPRQNSLSARLPKFAEPSRRFSNPASAT